MTMTSNRILNWQGCKNIRDLGGMKASSGSITRWGAIVRGDQPASLTANGWSVLYEHGIRTIISLRTFGLEEKEHPVVVSPYPDVQVISMDIEDVTNKEFVEKWASSELWSTPLYYRDALCLWPQRHADTIKAIAQAKPGGVLFHCKRGHDRTGIIALLLLSLVGVSAEDILADYQLSVDPEREELLAGRNTTTRETIFDVLNSLDVENYLISGGLKQIDIDALRNRFLETIPT
jgi:protein tyrosine/serine phosphatase